MNLTIMVTELSKLVDPYSKNSRQR